MKHLFKPEKIKMLIIILVIFAVIKLVWVMVETTLLPTLGVEHTEESGVKNLYYRVNFIPDRKIRQKSQESNQNIKDLQLIAVYSAEDIAVVAVIYKKKTHVLSSGDEINGFVLEGAGKEYATFSKNHKTYTVKLATIDATSQKSSITVRSSQEDAAVGDITDAGDRRIVDASLVRHYSANFDAIFKNIGINEIKKKGKIEGFKVQFVKNGSHFKKLGLQKGDIIKAINGREVNSEKVAFDIYKNINTMGNVTLKIVRNNKEMELEYEIN